MLKIEGENKRNDYKREIISTVRSIKIKKKFTIKTEDCSFVLQFPGMIFRVLSLGSKPILLNYCKSLFTKELNFFISEYKVNLL